MFFLRFPPTDVFHRTFKLLFKKHWTKNMYLSIQYDRVFLRNSKNLVRFAKNFWYQMDFHTHKRVVRIFPKLKHIYISNLTITDFFCWFEQYFFRASILLKFLPTDVLLRFSPTDVLSKTFPRNLEINKKKICILGLNISEFERSWRNPSDSSAYRCLCEISAYRRPSQKCSTSFRKISKK